MNENTLCEIKYEDITLAELLEVGLFFELDADKQVARILKRG